MPKFKRGDGTEHDDERKDTETRAKCATLSRVIGQSVAATLDERERERKKKDDEEKKKIPPLKKSSFPW